MQILNKNWEIFTPEKYSPPKKIFTPKIFIPKKYSPQKNIHSWKIFTPKKYSSLKNIHPLTKYSRRLLISHFKFLNSLLLINIAYIGSWKHFVSIFVCVCVSLSLPYHKSLSRSLLSPDDKVSENIWFVWSSLYHTVEVNGDVTMQSADGPPTNKCNV